MTTVSTPAASAVGASSSARPPKKQQPSSKKVVRIVFIALLLDLLAFTIPLPLFPRLINSFVLSESSLPSLSPTLLSRTLSLVRSLRSLLFSYSPLPPSPSAEARWDLTLLGGLLASGFSLCQFVISPRLGKASDRWGRRPVLLASMVGNLLSGALWVGASSFGIYSASRLIAGLSEGNVQLSIAVISDVTTEQERSRALALVGVAFSLAFTLGPSLGAYFASRPLSSSSSSNTNAVQLPIVGKVQLNSYATPALVTLVLLGVETAYLWACLPETRWWIKETEKGDGENPGEGKEQQKAVGRTKEQREKRLEDLQWLHLGFLFFFSGAEFTLTFLTYTLFDYTNAQNGRLLGFIGVLSSLLQGGYVRRLKSTPSGPLRLARSGIYTCVFSLALLAILPHLGAMGSGKSRAGVVLYLAAAGLAFVSATVVNSLNALASLQTSEQHGKDLERGAALGRFRSRGQLGRALGPLVATVVYWIYGPSACYSLGLVGMMWMAARIGKLGREERAEAALDARGKKEL